MFGELADRRWHCATQRERFVFRKYVPLGRIGKGGSTSWAENCHRLLGNTAEQLSLDGITGGISIRRYAFEIIDEIY